MSNITLKNVAMTGGTGLIGTELAQVLTRKGHTVTLLKRTRDWDPDAGTMQPHAVEGMDAIIHLAGENIGAGRWTPEFRKRVIESREKGTRAVAQAIAKATRKPQVFVSASATGFYGDTGDNAVDEQSPAGRNFLAEICQAWEKAAQGAGVRTVCTRIGVVLDPKGGALRELLPPARLGISTQVGDGRQWMSWISLDDVVQGLVFAMQNLEGIVNLVSPTPVQQRDLVKTLAHVLHRPALGFVPKFAMRAIVGSDKANELLITGQRVVPRVLQSSGFTFAHPQLEQALRHALRTA